VDPVWLGLESSGIAQWLRFSRWGYAIVNTLHVGGIALLVGSIVPLDLRLLGLWKHSRLDDLSRVLVPTAACALALALLSGTALFVSRASEYAAMPLFFVKLTLIAMATAHALLIHVLGGLSVRSPCAQKISGACSLFAWTGALVAGRFLAFVD